MWFVRQKINSQLTVHGNYFTIANFRAKIRRDILRDIWNFSLYFRVFIYLHHDFSPTPRNLDHQVVVVVDVVAAVVFVAATAVVLLHLCQQYSPF
jgi:hypothetical protein